MKSIHKIVAVSMALLILVSTAGFAMSAHFCGGKLQNVSFFSKVKTCETHIEKLPSCHKEQSSETNEEKNPCCEEQSIVKQAQEFKVQVDSLKELKPDLKFIALVVQFVVALVPESNHHFSSYTQYSPPLIERDIPVLVQSFLL